MKHMDPTDPDAFTVEVSDETLKALDDFAEAEGPWQIAKAIWKHFTLKEILVMPWGMVKFWMGR